MPDRDALALADAARRTGARPPRTVRRARAAAESTAATPPARSSSGCAAGARRRSRHPRRPACARRRLSSSANSCCAAPRADRASSCRNCMTSSTVCAMRVDERVVGVAAEIEQPRGLVAQAQDVLHHRGVVPPAGVGALIGRARRPGLVERAPQRLRFRIRHHRHVCRLIERQHPALDALLVARACAPAR